MSQVRFFHPPIALSPKEKKIAFIKQDPCYTNDTNEISRYEKLHVPCTIITPIDQKPDHFYVFQKSYRLEKNELLFATQERCLSVDEKGNIKIFDIYQQELQEDIDDYLFSEKAITLYNELKTKISLYYQEHAGKEFKPDHSPFKSQLGLTYQSFPEKKLINRKRGSHDNLSIMPNAVHYILHINRKGELKLFIDIKGELIKTKSQLSAGYISERFATTCLEDIPEQNLRDLFLKTLQNLANTKPLDTQEKQLIQSRL